MFKPFDLQSDEELQSNLEEIIDQYGELSEDASRELLERFTNQCKELIHVKEMFWDKLGYTCPSLPVDSTPL